MKICHVVPSLHEAKGGPSKSVRALCEALQRTGHEVELFTTAVHPDQEDYCSGGPVPIRTFRRDFPRGLYFSSGLNRALAQTDADVIHHHALWLRTLHYAQCAAVRRGVPLVVSPRGMMSRWAWHHHFARKQIARALVHPGAFERAAGWHVTSTEESADIRERGFDQPVCVAPNGVNRPSNAETEAGVDYWRRACPDTFRRPTALFYGRFHQKKRVIELIDLWLERGPSDWLLLIVGLPEEYSTEQLERYVQQQSGGTRVRVFSGAARPAPYAVASLFVLPSHNENFGLAVAEAMAYGVPVLVTDTTPWREINELGTGWCVKWDKFGATLEVAAALGIAGLAAKGAAAREWVLRTYSWDGAATRLAAFYMSLVSTRRG